MIAWDHPVFSLRQQCQLLGLHRSGLYYEPVPESAENLLLMRLLDRQYTRHPEQGVRRMTLHLRDLGHPVNVKRVRRLLRQMGLEAFYPKPRLSMPDPAAGRYPYLLKGMAISRPDQVWCADITYVGLPEGFAYLVAIMDWFSRYVIAWELSNSMESAFCVATLERALSTRRQPEIHNTDQGSQFTSAAFTGVLIAAGVRISMDGRGRWMDNVFIERLWRSLKHEDIYLKGYADGRETHAGIAAWFAFYNDRRPHQALGDCTPMAVWRHGIGDGFDNTAVDMTLRLDNAVALPTCPQPQQQQQRIAA